MDRRLIESTGCRRVKTSSASSCAMRLEAAASLSASTLGGALGDSGIDQRVELPAKQDGLSDLDRGHPRRPLAHPRDGFRSTDESPSAPRQYYVWSFVLCGLFTPKTLSRGLCALRRSHMI